MGPDDETGTDRPEGPDLALFVVCTLMTSMRDGANYQNRKDPPRWADWNVMEPDTDPGIQLMRGLVNNNSKKRERKKVARPQGQRL